MAISRDVEIVVDAVAKMFATERRAQRERIDALQAEVQRLRSEVEGLRAYPRVVGGKSAA